MNDDRQSRIHELFLKAVELPPEQWPAFLDEHCDDPGVRAEVESLLASHQRAARENFLPVSSGDGSTADLPPTREAAGAEVHSHIGKYRVERELSSGGMGVVYLASLDDGAFQLWVAVKVLKPGMDSEEIIRRFELERQVFAALNHPNIARLYDAGITPDGRPYFAMEYVDGLPIDDYCDKHRLTIRERLDLFRKICGAVQYVHQNLLVHRDLKPGNILVTEDGEPKLLDFGIAKLINPNLGRMNAPRTSEQFRFMTPEYASPEQVRGDPITTASDIYSLGVILYELISGHRPYHFTTHGQAVIEEVVCNRDPDRPSTAITTVEEVRDKTRAGRPTTRTITPQSVCRDRGTNRPDRLQRRVAGDIDNIILMALRKEPQRRYVSAEQFADDVSRHLGNLTVIARPDSLGYRTGKFVRRNRLPLAVTATFVIALAAGLVLTWIQYRQAEEARELAQTQYQRAEEARELAQTQYQRAEEARELAQTQFQRAEEARDSADAAYEFLERVLVKAAPHESGRDVTLMAVLESATERLREDKQQRPLVKARLLFTTGWVYITLSRFNEAEDALEESVRLRSEHAGEADPDTLRSRNELGLVYREIGRFDDAGSLFRDVLALRTRTLGAEHPDTLSTKMNWGIAHFDNGEYDEAQRIIVETLDSRRRVLGESHYDTLFSMYNLAACYTAQGRLQDDADLLQKAADLYKCTLERRRVVLGFEDPETLNTMNNLGVVYRDLGQYERASELLCATLRSRKTRLGLCHADTLRTMRALAKCHEKRNQLTTQQRTELEERTRADPCEAKEIQKDLDVLVNLCAPTGSASDPDRSP